MNLLSIFLLFCVPASAKIQVTLGVVDTATLQSDSVDTNKIKTDAVTNTKLLSDGASLSKVSAGTMTLSGAGLIIQGQNVGISTNTPIGKLTVNTGTNQNMLIKANTDASLQWVNDANSAYNTGRVYANPLLINPGGDGNVAIGNSSPGAVLDVEGAAQFGTTPTKSTFSATGALSIDTQASLQLGTTFYAGKNFVGVGTTTSQIGLATYDWVGNGQTLLQSVSNTSRANIAIVGGQSAEFTMWDLGASANTGLFHISVDAGSTIMESRNDTRLTANKSFVTYTHSTGKAAFANAVSVAGAFDAVGTSQFGAAPTLSTFTATTGFMALISSETITAGAVITANACGGAKIVYAASAVTTDTTNTFTAPAAANRGCVMQVCNTTAGGTITLDNNANFRSKAAADVALTLEDCITVWSDGAIWRQSTDIVSGD
jgi:hypothetical protein